MNAGKQPLRLWRTAVIGTVSVPEAILNPKNLSKLPADQFKQKVTKLKETFEEEIGDKSMPTEERKKLIDLLVRYHSTFSLRGDFFRCH